MAKILALVVLASGDASAGTVEFPSIGQDVRVVTQERWGATVGASGRTFEVLIYGLQGQFRFSIATPSLHFEATPDEWRFRSEHQPRNFKEPKFEIAHLNEKSPGFADIVSRLPALAGKKAVSGIQVIYEGRGPLQGLGLELLVVRPVDRGGGQPLFSAVDLKISGAYFDGRPWKEILTDPWKITRQSSGDYTLEVKGEAPVQISWKNGTEPAASQNGKVLSRPPAPAAGASGLYWLYLSSGKVFLIKPPTNSGEMLHPQEVKRFSHVGSDGMIRFDFSTTETYAIGMNPTSAPVKLANRGDERYEEIPSYEIVEIDGEVGEWAIVDSRSDSGAIVKHLGTSVLVQPISASNFYSIFTSGFLAPPESVTDFIITVLPAESEILAEIEDRRIDRKITLEIPLDPSGEVDWDHAKVRVESSNESLPDLVWGVGENPNEGIEVFYKDPDGGLHRYVFDAAGGADYSTIETLPSQAKVLGQKTPPPEDGKEPEQKRDQNSAPQEPKPAHEPREQAPPAKRMAVKPNPPEELAPEDVSRIEKITKELELWGRDLEGWSNSLLERMNAALPRNSGRLVESVSQNPEYSAIAERLSLQMNVIVSEEDLRKMVAELPELGDRPSSERIEAQARKLIEQGRLGKSR